ncbi:MAG: hypothetical protein IKI40_01915 [Treponema sp.]|nr:hypothetical protein [Treponema sp.]
MLYLGKNRGRNCYTLYEEEKHRDIEIHKMANKGMFTNMYKLKLDVENERGFKRKLLKAMPQIAEMLQIEDLYYVGPDGKMRAVLDRSFLEDAGDIGIIVEEDLFSESSLDLVKKHSPVFYKALIKNGFETVLVSRIRKREKTKGYLVCAVKRSLRLWQEDECAILFYLADLL